ncbi:MAG TPA: DUF1501 domain-containing protein [Chthonomonadales bacterium]|nr:DUF1501 domain-containing protein [Chthonomonadales bacterium]
MLTIQGNKQQFCDGITRREFLQIGSLALGGLALPQILAAEARAGIRSSHKAIIMIFLPGGPPHQDMFDLKPDAPPEIRGEFKPIKTNVPGIEICEHLPRIAAMMDKFAIIRSLVGARDEHASNICLSGYTVAETNQSHAPCLGAVLSKLKGPVEKTVPAFVGLSPKTAHMPWGDPGDPGFLGLEHAPLRPEGELMSDMVLKGISLERLADRRRLLASLDRFRRAVDSVKGMDALHQRAFDMLTSSKLVHALDVTKEDPKVRARYGQGRSEPVDDGAPMIHDHFLAARRLVEAGVRCVTLSYGRWDYHGNNFGQLKQYLPMLDQAVSALVQDIHDRGLDKDVSVVVWGEFGRTPKVNSDAGRDHWPRVSCCLLAGGGMRTGQVIGSTTRFAEEADERPVHYKDVMATLYHNLGIDVGTTPVPDATGRPHYLLEGHEPIPELL